MDTRQHFRKAVSLDQGKIMLDHFAGRHQCQQVAWCHTCLQGVFAGLQTMGDVPAAAEQNEHARLHDDALCMQTIGQLRERGAGWHLKRQTTVGQCQRIVLESLVGHQQPAGHKQTRHCGQQHQPEQQTPERMGDPGIIHRLSGSGPPAVLVIVIVM